MTRYEIAMRPAISGRPTNPANAFITHTSTLFCRLRHGLNLFADITLKLWQKRHIGSCIMNLASDEWRVSSSIDISIKYFLPRSARAFRRCNLNVMVRTGPNLKSTWSSSSIFVYKDRQYFPTCDKICGLQLGITIHKTFDRFNFVPIHCLLH